MHINSLAVLQLTGDEIALIRAMHVCQAYGNGIVATKHATVSSETKSVCKRDGKMKYRKLAFWLHCGVIAFKHSEI